MGIPMEYDPTETKRCPHCLGHIRPDAEVCRHCRKPVKTKTRKVIGRYLVAFSVLSLVGIFFVEPVYCIVTAVILFVIGALMGGYEFRPFGEKWE